MKMVIRVETHRARDMRLRRGRVSGPYPRPDLERMGPRPSSLRVPPPKTMHPLYHSSLGTRDPTTFPTLIISLATDMLHRRSSHLIISLLLLLGMCARSMRGRHQMRIGGRKNWVIHPTPIKRPAGWLLASNS